MEDIRSRDNENENQEQPNGKHNEMEPREHRENRACLRDILQNLCLNDKDSMGLNSLSIYEIQRAVIAVLIAILIGVVIYSDKSAACELVRKDFNICEQHKEDCMKKAQLLEDSNTYCRKSMSTQEKENLKRIHRLELKNMEDHIMSSTELEREKVQDGLVESTIVWEEKVRAEKTIQELDRLRRKLREMGRVKCKNGFWSEGEEKSTILQQQDQVRGFATESRLVKGLGVLKGLEDLFNDPCSLNERMIEMQLLVWETKTNERMWHDIYYRSKIKQLDSIKTPDNH